MANEETRVEAVAGEAVKPAVKAKRGRPKKVTSVKAKRAYHHHYTTRAARNDVAFPQSVMGYVDTFTNIPIDARVQNTRAVNRLSEMLDEMSLANTR